MARSLVRDEPKMLDRARDNAGTLAASVSVLWVVHLVNVLAATGLGWTLNGFGIVPRAVDGLWGILFAPFLHANFAHLLVNTLSFLLLGAVTMTRKRLDFWVVTVIGALGSGLGVWLFGAAGSVTVGASGVIFAYLGFLMARGLFERSVRAIVLSVLVTWLFGSMVWGVLPAVAAGISWQAHLFGFLSGIGTAATLGNAIRTKKSG